MPFALLPCSPAFFFSRVSFRIHSLDYEDSRRPHPLMMDSAEQRLTVEGRAMKLGNGNRPVRHIPPADNCNPGELGLAQISFSRSSGKKIIIKKKAALEIGNNKIKQQMLTHRQVRQYDQTHDSIQLHVCPPPSVVA